MTEDPISTSLGSIYVKRWRTLSRSVADLDYEFGTLSQSIRSKFPDGASGDYQFRSWVMKRLSVGVNAATKALTTAKAVSSFKKEEWRLLGSWKTIQFVMNLPARSHRRIMARVRDYNTEKGHAPSYHVVRSMAFDLGFRSRVRGRPLRSETEERLSVLRGWIDHLYTKFKLPEMPLDVETAMSGVRLIPR